MNSREQIEEAIAQLEMHQEALGEVLGVNIVTVTLAALRRQLAELATAVGGAGSHSPYQRKQVTVLFADVSGFTTLAEAMDPEDMNQLMNALWDQIDQAIVGHGGRIDKHMGDGVMALWGAGPAREDDPILAIQAALEIQRKVMTWRQAMNTFPLFKGHTDISIRVGIHTGPVLLGTIGTLGEYTAIGDTVNTAARLQESAPIGGILVSQATYQYVREHFAARPLGAMTLRGKVTPVQAYEITQATPFYPERRDIEGIITHMVGRDKEVQQLQTALRQVWEVRQMRFLTLLGDVGVGKSRLLRELADWLAKEGWPHGEYQARATLEMAHVPYGLLRALFATYFHIYESDQPQVVWHKLWQGFVEAYGDNPETATRAYFLGRLLGFAFAGPALGAAFPEDAQQRRDLAQTYLYDYFRAATQTRPVLIWLEDIHWADQSSLEIIRYLALALAEAPIGIICSARPRLVVEWPNWTERPSSVVVQLRPLSKADTRQLIRELLHKLPLPPDSLINLIVKRADGNPLFVEELVKIMVQDGVLHKLEPHWTADLSRLADLNMPVTLNGILQARLDSLPTLDRQLLQQAAVVGRVFWDGAVVQLQETAVFGIADPATPEAIWQAFNRLCAQGVLRENETSSFPGQREYIFAHNLLHEVAYERVLKRARRIYHAVVSDWLIAHGVKGTRYISQIATHLALAGDGDRAWRYYVQAGEQAAAVFANAEAITYFSRALEWITADDDETRYNILAARESIYHLLGQQEQQRQDLQAMERLAERLNNASIRSSVSLRLAAYALTIGDYAGAVVAAQTAVRLTPATQDPVLEATGYLRWGQALFYQGHYAAAFRQLQQTLHMAETAVSITSMPARVWQHLRAECLYTSGQVAIEEGQMQQARYYYEAALQIYHDIDDRRGEGQAFNQLGIISQTQSDYSAARIFCLQALQICRRVSFRAGEAMALDTLGLVSHAQGDYRGAMTYHNKSLTLYRDMNDRRGQARTLQHLGNSLTRLGDYGAAVTFYQQALTYYQDMNDGRHQAATLDALGQMSDVLGQYAEAQAYFDQALALYRVIGARSPESFSLGRLCLTLHHLGQDMLARDLAREALWLAREVNEPAAEGLALLCLGHTHERLGDLVTAVESYESLRQMQTQLPDLWLEALGGLARVSLRQGRFVQAKTQGDLIMDQLKTHAVELLHEPARLYLTCYELLVANRDHRVPLFLNEAYQVLQHMANRISSESTRHLFLQQVTANRELGTVYDRYLALNMLPPLAETDYSEDMAVLTGHDVKETGAHLS